MKIFNLKWLLGFAIFTFIACAFLEKNIKEINSIKEVENIFQQATQNDLFVFDVDDTILEPQDPQWQDRFYHNPEVRKSWNQLVDFLKNKSQNMSNPDECMDILFSKLLQKAKYQPIETALIDNILMLQKKGIKVIALTAMHSGKMGLIEKFEDWRYKQLASLGLDFSSSFALQDFTFDGLQQPEEVYGGGHSGPAVFCKGIAATGRFAKGVVLRAFLEKVGFKPAHIYFFDDKLKNVKSVTTEMKKMGIRCQGFVYKAATFNRSADDMDIEVVKFQRELMKEREDYVSYIEAKEILEQQKGLHENKTQQTQCTP